MFGLCNLILALCTQIKVYTFECYGPKPSVLTAQNLNQIRVNVIIVCNSYIRKRFTTEIPMHDNLSRTLC